MTRRPSGRLVSLLRGGSVHSASMTFDLRHGWATVAVLALTGASAALLVSASHRASARAPATSQAPSVATKTQSAAATTISIDASVTEQIRAAIAKSGLGSRVTAVVGDVDRDAVIVDLGGARPMRPASNQKAITTGLAMMVLGEGFSFGTKLLLQGDRLTIVGDGDPSLGDPELLSGTVWKDAQGTMHTGLTPEQLVDQWARAVERLRLPRIREIVVDDRIFAREGPHPDWPRDQLDATYCVACWGINFHFNSLRFWLTPKDGKVAWRTQPAAPWLTVVNDATARQGKGVKQSAGIARAQGTDAYAIKGNVAKADGPYIVTMQDPPLFLGNLLASRLRTNGIDVGSVRIATAQDAAATGTSVGPTLTTPLSSVVTRANTDSENLYAEALLKRAAAKATGRPGSWADGQDLMRTTLRAAIGSEVESFAIRDGSGMSKENRITALGMARWLLAMPRMLPDFDAYLRSFAEGGSSGTLKKRMDGIPDSLARVWCKTGYIAGTSCLSGYVICANGRRFAMSVLCNDLKEGEVGKAKDLQDAVAAILARQPAR